jgi:hypothetical protein
MIPPASRTHIWAGGFCFAKPLYARPNVVNSRRINALFYRKK